MTPVSLRVHACNSVAFLAVLLRWPWRRLLLFAWRTTPLGEAERPHLSDDLQTC